MRTVYSSIMLLNLTFQDFLHEGGSIGPRSAEAIVNQIQDVRTPQISNLLEKLTDEELSQTLDTTGKKQAAHMTVSLKGHSMLNEPHFGNSKCSLYF